jgi:hypothetical protein
MANLHRGEADLVIDGERLTLRLTLGVLAEIEAMTRGLDTQRLSLAQLIDILALALKAGGNDVGRPRVASWPASVVGEAVRALEELFAATFGADPGDGGTLGPPPGRAQVLR